MESLELEIAEWRSFVGQAPAVDGRDVDELEAHLRDQIADLNAAGLAADEAFLIAVKRMGSLDDLSREFAREHSERLWKQLVLTREIDSQEVDTQPRRDLLAMVICATGAAASIKVPALFGMSVEEDVAFYGPNFGL